MGWLLPWSVYWRERKRKESFVWAPKTAASKPLTRPSASIDIGSAGITTPSTVGPHEPCEVRDVTTSGGSAVMQGLLAWGMPSADSTTQPVRFAIARVLARLAGRLLAPRPESGARVRVGVRV